MAIFSVPLVKELMKVKPAKLQITSPVTEPQELKELKEPVLPEIFSHPKKKPRPVPLMLTELPQQKIKVELHLTSTSQTQPKPLIKTTISEPVKPSSTIENRAITVKKKSTNTNRSDLELNEELSKIEAELKKIG
ncbi:hypothetical protein HYU21_01220 [Candidatus Woesearchaeota archaeon]|nr:hypothetical protein [Candidatus Woesearchaeota archaeon]